MHTLITSFLLFFVGATSAAAALFDIQIALAVAVGFLTMTANVWLTRKTVRQFTSGGRSALVGLYLFKMAILFGLLYLFLSVLALDVIALAVGLTLPMAVMIFAGNRWMAMEDDSASSDDSIDPIQSGV
jgi:hypothetical protein|tara:strand:+ start:229 stop:615 length:387 start_codon:yes stop_codon:yes gene_type:complete